MRQFKDVLLDKYEEGLTDYWMPPLVAQNGDRPIGRIGDSDTLFLCCRRGEREIQLTEAFVDGDFPHFERGDLGNLDVVTMVQYHDKFKDIQTAFPPSIPENVLGQVLDAHGKRQTLVAESEKQTHVTYFFNGRRGALLPSQEAKIVPSRTDFAEHPEMRSPEIGDAIVEALPDSDFVLANFAAGDVIGHLLDFDVKVRCVEVIDKAVRKVLDAAASQGFTVLITADHGLIERGRNEDGSHSIAHTTAPVRFVAVHEDLKGLGADLMVEGGALCDVAPTVLEFMGLPVSAEMSGEALLKAPKAAQGKVLLLVLDGWGIGEQSKEQNPIYAATTPAIDGVLADYPHTAIEASGPYVGLPDGRAGNSETGHLTMGAGRVVEQDEVRLRRAIETGFRDNSVMRKVFARAAEEDRTVHLVGLLSEASSHGSVEEVFQVGKLARELGVGKLFLHCILDGRSAPPRGAVDLLAKHESALASLNLVTLVGRGYALDRGRDYIGKTQLVYNALVSGVGTPCWGLLEAARETSC